MLICCIKVGTKYGPEYPNRLAAMVKRHMTEPYEFICLTDNGKDLNCDWSPIKEKYPGWWSKMLLFKPHPVVKGRRVLFLDLDTLIIGPLKELTLYNGPFCILRDFYRPEGYGSAVMSISAGYGGHIWESFIKDPAYWISMKGGDQDCIKRNVNNADLWQDRYPGKVVSYKVDCQSGPPPGASVVCFHGVPRPADVVDMVGWVKEAWTE